MRPQPEFSVEKTTTIEDMVDMQMAKWPKVSTSMNTIGLCKTKENVLECIANWLSLLNHNFTVKKDAPPLLYGVFFSWQSSLHPEIITLDMPSLWPRHHGFLYSTLSRSGGYFQG
eukprot:6090819-Ditylum_brightwellii.AAC.1